MKKATKKKKREKKKPKTKALKVREKTPPPVPAGSIKSVDGLMQLALQTNAGLDKLEKLIEMKYRHEAREAKKEFFMAMSQFQAEVDPITKDKHVTYNDYWHATLGQIERQIKDPLARNLLSKSFEIDDSAKIKVTCIVTHANGHSEKTTMEADPDVSGGKNTIQSRGSTITYLSRYTLLARLGLVTADEDNDGRTSNTKPEKSTSAPPAGVFKKPAATKTAEPVDDIPTESGFKAGKHPLQAQINALKRLFSKLNPGKSDDKLRSLWFDMVGFEKDLTMPRIKELSQEFTKEINKRKKEQGK